VKRELAERTYDDVIGTFDSNGVVDEETKRTISTSFAWLPT
jgi:hypothetical protein